MSSTRSKRRYDHRLIDLVRETGDATIATRIGAPRSTASGWTRRWTGLIRALVKAERLSPEFAETLLGWAHSGFSVFVGDPVDSGDTRAQPRRPQLQLFLPDCRRDVQDRPEGPVPLRNEVNLGPVVERRSD